MKFKKFKNYGFILAGSFIYVLGLNLFLTPSNIFTVGVMGLSQELSFFINGTFDLSPYFYFFFNIPILFLGWYKVGKKFTMRTFFSIIIITILQNIIPTNVDYLNDTLLNVFTGSILLGTGLGMILKQGSSTGGTDVIAMFISLVQGKGFGTINIILNTIVMILAYIVTNDVSTVVYMMISLYIMGVLVDKIHNSHQKLSLFVVTSYPSDVRDTIFDDLGRGCTILDSYGGQQFKKNSTMLITISKEELYLAIKLIKEADESAFINVMPVESVVGFFQNNFKRILE